MSYSRHAHGYRKENPTLSRTMPLDIQCWLLAVASTLCEGDHCPSCSGLTAVRRALTRGNRHDLANALSALLEQQPDDMPKKLRAKLRLLVAEVRFSTNRRVRHLSSEVVHLSLCAKRDAC